MPHKVKKTKVYAWQSHVVFVWAEKQDVSAGRHFPLLHCFSWQHNVLTLEVSECLCKTISTK